MLKLEQIFESVWHSVSKIHHVLLLLLLGTNKFHTI